MSTIPTPISPAARLAELEAQLAQMAKERDLAVNRLKWLHDCSQGTIDAEGCEWGIYRVKWQNGKAVEVWQTNSDFSDLDAEMARQALSSAAPIK